MALNWQKLRKHSSKFAGRHSAIVMLGGAGVISGLLFVTAPAPLPEQPEEKAWPVSVAVANPGSHRPSFRAYGKVESRNLAELSADLFAIIRTIRVREGDAVRAGDVLVTLDDGELALDVTARAAEVVERAANVRSIELELKHLRSVDPEHRSLLAVAQAKLTRHEQLRSDQLISQSLLDEVQRQVNSVKIDYQSHSQRLANLPNRLQAATALHDVSEAAWKRAKLTASKTQITAPFDGVVLAVPAAIGARAQPGTPLVSVADAAAYEVRVAVPANHSLDFAQARRPDAAQPAAISATLPDGSELPFSRLAGAVKPGQTNADALFSLSSDLGSEAPIGTTLELQISLPLATEVVALPVQALYENERVYRIVEERLQPITVSRIGERRGPEGEYQVLVRAPELTKGSRIITTQLPKATAGLKVATIADPDSDLTESVAQQPEPATATPSIAPKAGAEAEPDSVQAHNAALKPLPRRPTTPPLKGSNPGATQTTAPSSRRYRMS